MPDHSHLLGQLVEDFTARVRAGQLPDLEEYARQHPELAERIRALFPTLLLLEGMARNQPAGELGEAKTLAPEASGDALLPGQMFNQYRIERELGRGGMGVIYEAVHLPLDKRVALKVLPIFAAQGPSQLERFLREARTAAALHHTNVVPVFDIGQANGLPYYAMQFIRGCGLDQVLHSIQADQPASLPATPPAPTGPYTPREDEPPLAHQKPKSGPASELIVAARVASADYFRRVAELGIQAAQGLAYAHERGVIHRDIKPSNLILDEAGVLWITDFGLARRADDPDLTHSGVLVGTPRYMSPEQAEAARRPIDHRTDVYSLGATVYELVTRRPAFSGQTPVDVVMQVLEREPVAPRRLDPAVPRDLETVVLKAMAKRPQDRYQSAAELADDLRRWLRMEPIRARAIGPVGRTIRWCRRNPRLARLTAGSLLLSVSTILLIFALLYARSVYSHNLQLQEESYRMAAEDQRDMAQNAREQALDALTTSLYQEARAQLASHQPGRRWQTLELLRTAEKLRNRVREGTDGGSRRVDSAKADEPAIPTVVGNATGKLPDRVELRSEAVAALLLRDARMLREWQLDVFTSDLAVSADGSRLAILERKKTAHSPAEANGDLRILDAENRQLARWQDRRLANCYWLALSPDGKVLATQMDDKIGLWDAQSGQLRRMLAWPESPTSRPEKTERKLLSGLFFTPDNAHLVTVASTPQLSDEAASWSHLSIMLFRLFQSLFSSQRADGNEATKVVRQLLPQLTAFQIVLWPSQSDGPGERLILPVEGQYLDSLIFSGSGKLAAWATGQQSVTVRQAGSGKKLLDVRLPLRIKGPMAFAPADNVLAIACQEGNQPGVVLFWDLAQNTERSRFRVSDHSIESIAFRPGANQLAVGLTTGSIVVIDVGENEVAFQLEEALPSPVTMLSWHPDGRQLFSGDQLGTLKLWAFPGDSVWSTFRSAGGAVTNMAFSPDGQFLVTATSRGQILLFNRKTGTLERSLPETGLKTKSLVVSPDSRRSILLDGSQLVVSVAELDSGKELAHRVMKEFGRFESAAWTPEGDPLVLLLAAEKSSSVQDVFTGKRIWQMSGNGKLMQGCLSPDGRMLAGLAQSGEEVAIQIWDLSTGRKVAEQQNKGVDLALHFSQDGRWLLLRPRSFGSVLELLARVMTDNDKNEEAWFSLSHWSFMIRMGKKSMLPAAETIVWNATKTDQRLSIRGSDLSLAYAFSPDSRLLVVGYRDGSAQLWDLEQGKQIFHWALYPRRLERLALEFTPDGESLASSDGISPIRFLHLALLRRHLADLRLDW